VKQASLPPPSATRSVPSGRRLPALLDLLGRRWSLRVLWELRKKKRKFRDLRAACDDVSPSVLNQRLSELRLAGVVAHDAEGYALTARGSVLLEVLAPLEGLANRWSLGAAVPEKRPRVVAPKAPRPAPTLVLKPTRLGAPLTPKRAGPPPAFSAPKARPAPTLVSSKARPTPTLVPPKARPAPTLVPPKARPTPTLVPSPKARSAPPSAVPKARSAQVIAPLKAPPAPAKTRTRVVLAPPGRSAAMRSGQRR
jgi:DNA-binding HxlR family transcriptional regulator